MPLTFYRPIPHSSNHPHTALPPSRRRPQRPPGIAIGNLKIQDGRGFGLAQAVRAVERRGFGMMLLTKKKIQLEAYSHNFLGYNVTCSEARPYIVR